MSVITVSREFGSGGRELGERLAGYLGYAYYDKEILSAAARRDHVDERYAELALEKGVAEGIPRAFGRTFSLWPALQHQQEKTGILLAQSQVLKELAAKRDCVIIGRGADAVLEEFHPLNLFVYAELPFKIERCRRYGAEGEILEEKELKARIRQVDQNRSQYYALVTGERWGEKKNYHLCVNTTDADLDRLALAVAEYARRWLEAGGRDG